MNYRHAYHAGNFADVTKHLGLLCLLDRLLAKDKPFSVLETHAGRGSYDLESAEARQSREAADGILRLARIRPVPVVVGRYLELVKSIQPATGGTRFYPGSPEIISRSLRTEDRAMFCELQPDEAKRLRARYADDRRVAVHHRDGYGAIRALLPPAPRRGLMFIDPPYEAPDEFDRLLAAMTEGLRRWPEGVFVAWYPIKDKRGLRGFERRLGDGSFGPVLSAEFMVRPADHAAHLNGSGLVVVRPPWRLHETLTRLWSELPELLGDRGVAHAAVRWLCSPDDVSSSTVGRGATAGRIPDARGRC